MKILVTGGAGFVGANLIRALLQVEHTIRVLDNFSTGQHAYLHGLDLDLHTGDIQNTGQVSSAVRGMDAIIHLAAQTGVPGSLADPFHDCRVNVLGTLNLLEAAREHHIKRFVLASSNAPLGRQKPPAREDLAPLPISPYGASKLAAEAYCLAYHGSWGLGTIVLRFANLYGPFSAHKSSVVAKFFKDLHNHGAITIDGDGLQTRDFIYVGDLCRAIILALESPISGEVFQIATGVETSILQLATLMEEITGKKAARSHIPNRQGDIRKNYSQITKAFDILGWLPVTSLTEGLQHTHPYFQQGLLNSVG